MIWVDEHGALGAAPARRRPAVDAFLAAVLVTSLLLAGLAALHRAVVWRLDRRRMRDWQMEWLTIEPLWRRR